MPFVISNQIIETNVIIYAPRMIPVLGSLEPNQVEVSNGVHVPLSSWLFKSVLIIASLNVIIGVASGEY
jgi:hypothetical protein